MPTAIERNMTSQTTHIKMAIHGHFYRWAAQYVNDQVVLDIGCGDGTGAIELARHAKSVCAIDSDPAIITAARENDEAKRVNFKVMDCHQLNYPDNSFDVVLNNALLEYVTDIPGFMSEARRVLRADGAFICGTKNLDLSLKRRDGVPLYENHIREFSIETLAELVASFYQESELFGQMMTPKAFRYIMDTRALGLEQLLVRWEIKTLIPRGVRKYLRGLVTGVKLEELGPEDFYVSHESIRDALYLLAVATRPRKPCAS